LEKMKNKKKILIMSLSYPPNIGGVETHLYDYVNYLNKINQPAVLLTYQPITTKVRAKSFEKSGGVEIRRISWFGNSLFLKLKNQPFLEFLYLFFPLLIFSFILLFRSRDIRVIHAHGLIAGFAAVIVNMVFKRKILISTHSIYNFPKQGLYRRIAHFTFSNCDSVLVLSKQSEKEMISLGIDKKKVHVFTYWVDQNIFRPNRHDTKSKMGWNDEFVVLFVGRLIEEKGIVELLEAASLASNKIRWVIAGTGPLEELIKQKSKINNSIVFLGKIKNQDLASLYNAADLLLVPSTHEEGFGRVILEALSCGLPVIAANRGGIVEAMNSEVGELIEINPKNISQSVEKLRVDRGALSSKSKAAIAFAKKRFSDKNARVIINLYE